MYSCLSQELADRLTAWSADMARYSSFKRNMQIADFLLFYKGKMCDEAAPHNSSDLENMFVWYRRPPKNVPPSWFDIIHTVFYVLLLKRILENKNKSTVCHDFGFILRFIYPLVSRCHFPLPGHPCSRSVLFPSQADFHSHHSHILLISTVLLPVSLHLHLIPLLV